MTTVEPLWRRACLGFPSAVLTTRQFIIGGRQVSLRRAHLEIKDRSYEVSRLGDMRMNPEPLGPSYQGSSFGERILKVTKKSGNRGRCRKLSLWKWFVTNSLLSQGNIQVSWLLPSRKEKQGFYLFLLFPFMSLFPLTTNHQPDLTNG